MKNLVGIVGDVGTGKSTSIEKLDPKTTFIINILGKPLPFKGSAKKYNAENKNWASVSTHTEICQVIKGVSETRPEIETIVLDDIGYVMSTEFFKRASESGYNKFSEIGQHMFQIVNTANSVREGLNVVFMFHEQIDLIDGYAPMKSIKTIGKMLDDKFNIAGLFTVLMFTDVEFGKEGAKYSFVTNRTATVPAKSPRGMFEDIKIPNDLSTVLSTIKDYYN